MVSAARSSALQAGPGVERVVHDQTMLEHFVVIGKVAGKSIRNRKQPVALRGEIGPRRIRAADDHCEMVQRLIVNVVDADDCIKGTVLADVAEFSIFDVVRRASYLTGDLGDLTWRDIDEFGIGVDEAADQPRARNAVDLRMLARDPFVFRRAALSPCGQTRFLPAGNAAVKICSLKSGLAQSRGCAL